MVDQTTDRTVRRVAVKLSFPSPLEEVLPKEGKMVTAELLLPSTERKPSAAVIVLPPTGDHSVGLRRILFGAPLSNRGIVSVLPVMPFTGSRRPPEQSRSSLRYVSDLFAMGAAVALEVLEIIHYLRTREGISSFVITGTSLGGFMAALIASKAASPDVAAVPIVSPCRPSTVYCDGEFHRSVSFAALQKTVTPDVFTSVGFDPADATSLTKEAAASPEGARNALRMLLDECSSLTTYPPPIMSGACTQVLAQHDKYVANYRGDELLDHWPNSTVRYLPAGHVSAMLFRHELLRAIETSLSRLTNPLPHQ
jgi:predicted alpha/beta hydrolase family esterase